MKIDQLNLTSLKYFFDTVETGSLTEAAALNFVTRPAISQALTRLETWSGMRLLEHRKRTFELTREGQKFYRIAKRSYGDFAAAMRAESGGQDRLKVGCSLSLADGFLIPALKRLDSLKNIEIKTGNSRFLLRNLEDREINLALFIDEIHARGFQTKILHSGSYTLASKSGSFEKLVVTTEERPEVVALRRQLRSRSETAHEFITIESWSLCARMAIQLGGVCLVPDFMATAPLRPVRLKGFKPRYQIRLAHPRIELVSEAEDRLIRLLKP